MPALGVAADLGEHAAPPSAAGVADLLGDYRKAVPAVQSLAVTSGGAVLASTEAAPPARVGALGAGSRPHPRGR
ncbi:MAG: hypothetical protein U0599_28445 [Vicinamibacteria bacterium]